MTDSRLPTVSVVIPCFNQAHFLASAIASAQAQDGVAVETVVVDDGSPDDASAVARACGASVVIRQCNQGLSAARNAGLRAARGEFVVFLDGDDELIPHVLAPQIAILRSRTDVACVAGLCALIDAAGRALPSTPSRIDGDDLYAELLAGNFIWTPGSVAFRRSDILSAGGFPIDGSPAADYGVYLRFARERRPIATPTTGVRYPPHGANMSRDSVKMFGGVRP